VLLDEKIAAIANALAEARIPYAIGGANALAYYATVRATQDIDVNVFVPASEAPKVLDVLGALGVATDRPGLAAQATRDGQLRVFWETAPIDLFFSYDAVHDSSMARRRSVPFGPDARIDILSAEDLMTYKAIFNRPKDWRDIGEMIFAALQPLDFDYVRGWIRRLDAPDVDRLAKLEALIRSGGEEPVS
jgi:hypothetical protein